MPGQQILLKRSGQEEKKPVATNLAFGEVAVNYHDGNIFFRKSDDSLVEIKRLDSRLNDADIVSTILNGDGDIGETLYSTGNKAIFYYVNVNLVKIVYTAVDGVTELYAQNITYNENDDLIGTSWETL
jgi:hypothetical protein